MNGRAGYYLVEFRIGPRNRIVNNIPVWGRDGDVTW